jgi:hypothetical protein
MAKIPTKNQIFPQRNASLSMNPALENSSIELGRSSTNDTDNITPPENPNPNARSRTEGFSVRKANAAPMVVANPAKPVRISAIIIVSSVTIDSCRIIGITKLLFLFPHLKSLVLNDSAIFFLSLYFYQTFILFFFGNN